MTPDETRRVLERLRDAGLPGILVSASMFHNEFVPFARTRTCTEAAADVFGLGGVTVWMPQTYALLARLPDDGTRTLEEFCRLTGLPPGSRQVPKLYDLIAGGRAPEALRDYYDAAPAEHFKDARCLRDLLSTSHFHVDHHGNLFTGLCAGLAPANVEDLHPTISEQQHPVFWRLCHEGPFGLMRVAADLGYTPKDEGYVSSCDLCFDVRRHLHATGRFPELRPDAYYTC